MGDLEQLFVVEGNEICDPWCLQTIVILVSSGISFGFELLTLESEEFDVCCAIFAFRAGIWTVYEQPAGSYMPRHPRQLVSRLYYGMVLAIMFALEGSIIIFVVCPAALS